MERKLIKIDRNGTKYYSDCTCQRCGGKGRISYYSFIEGGICFECGGSGVSKERIEKEYTPEYRAKLDAKREAKKEAEKSQKIGELMAHKAENLERLGFKDGKTYCVCGDTYAIKDELKAAGAKFSRELGWHFSEPVTAYACIEIVADEVISDELDWWYGKPCFKFTENAAAIVKAKMPKKEVVSEYVGEVGKKVNLKLTLKRVYSYETHYNRYRWSTDTAYINSFEDESGNVFVWKTSSWSGDEGQTYEISGTIKDHSEYKGIKQNILTRCKIA